MTGWYRNLIIRWRAQMAGIFRNNRIFSEVCAALFYLRACIPVGKLKVRLEALLAAARLSEHRALRALIEKKVRMRLIGPQVDCWRQNWVGLSRYSSGFEDIRRKSLTTSLLLKEPGPNGEKGVLYSSFEYNWLRLVENHDARRFFSDYYLVGASSWSPPDYASFVHFAGLSADPIFIGISNRADVKAYRLASPIIEPIPLMACDWINPDFYQPRPKAQRSIDILMIANWLLFKRHWLLFEALRYMRRDLRVVLVGRNGPGRTEKELRAEALAFGVPQKLEFHTNISIEEVTRLQCDARIAALFSIREGSCVAPVECFFADTPVAMMHDAHVGSRAYINEQTGILVKRSGLAHNLEQLLEEAERYSPRAWAMANVTCYHSSARLNALLKAHSEETSRPWTQDIAPLCWRYVPTYVHNDDEVRLAPGVERLRERYGINLQKFVFH
jgi:glycosyltransferase involved in cell wall biosynthesis